MCTRDSYYIITFLTIQYFHSHICTCSQALLNPLLHSCYPRSHTHSLTLSRIGVVHRDLKPENLLLSDPSDSAILKIADFGLSAVVFAAECGGGSSSGGSAVPDAPSAETSPYFHHSTPLASPVGVVGTPYSTPTNKQQQSPQQYYSQQQSPQQQQYASVAAEQKEREYLESLAAAAHGGHGRGHGGGGGAAHGGFSTPTYCTPPAHHHNNHNNNSNNRGSGDSNLSSVIGTPEMLGPPLPSSSNNNNNRHYHDGLGSGGGGGNYGIIPLQGAPMRRLKSVVGSPHYIAPEIACNGKLVLSCISDWLKAKVNH